MEDLREILETGLARGGRLLTAGERHVVHAMLALSPDALRWWARLTQRTFESYPRAELPADVAAELTTAGLIDALVTSATRLSRATVDELRSAARAAGLSPRGNRDALIERLQGRFAPTDPWYRIRHRGLILRLERWAALSRAPDRSLAIVERLGFVRWPRYALTPGPGLWPTRRAMLRWERLLADHERREPAENLADIAAGVHRAPGRLDLGRRVLRAIADAARLRERAGALAEARDLYCRLVDHGAPAGDLALRVARTLEAEGQPHAAFAWLTDHRPDPRAEPDAAVEITRVGRRLARTLGRGWAPDAPLVDAAERSWTLPAGAPVANRPGWRVDARDLPVEAALVARLAAHGRVAVHAEGQLWTTLFALLFADLYFLPVDGALPVARLTGPLDLGTPAFAARRRPHVDAVLSAITAGEAHDRIVDADARWRGCRLAGAAWHVLDGASLAAVAGSLGPQGLTAVMERLLQSWRVSRGLPDLVVLPGDPVRLPDAFPSRLGPGLQLAEVKGPADSLRPEQRVWADVLKRAGAPIEWWWVKPAA